MGERDRGYAAARGRVPDLGGEAALVPQAQHDLVGDPEHEDLVRLVELGLPPEAVDVEAARGAEVGHGEGDEADALVHVTPPASSRRACCETRALASRVVEVAVVEPVVEGLADPRPLEVGDREPVGVAVAALVDHGVAEAALPDEAQPDRGAARAAR